MFLFGPPNIEKLKTKLNVPGLVKAMDYKKESSDAARLRSGGRQQSRWVKSAMQPVLTL